MTGKEYTKYIASLKREMEKRIGKFITEEFVEFEKTTDIIVTDIFVDPIRRVTRDEKGKLWSIAWKTDVSCKLDLVNDEDKSKNCC